jgi:hypothetical protein
MVEVFVSYKRTSLLQHGVKYGSKGFYNMGRHARKIFSLTLSIFLHIAWRCSGVTTFSTMTLD